MARKCKIKKNMELLKKNEMTRREDIITPKRSGAIFKYTEADINKILSQRSQLEERLREMQNKFRDLVFSDECVIEIRIRKKEINGD